MVLAISLWNQSSRVRGELKWSNKQKSNEIRYSWPLPLHPRSHGANERHSGKSTGSGRSSSATTPVELA